MARLGLAIWMMKRPSVARVDTLWRYLGTSAYTDLLSNDLSSIIQGSSKNLSATTGLESVAHGVDPYSIKPNPK